MCVIGVRRRIVSTGARADSSACPPPMLQVAPRRFNLTAHRMSLAAKQINPAAAHLASTRRPTKSTVYWTDPTSHRWMQPPMRVMLTSNPFNPRAHCMNEFNIVTLNTLTRVQRFLDDNNAALEDINTSGYRAILDDAVTNLSAHAINQTGSQRKSIAETAKERVLRNNLKLNHMRRIAMVARAQLRQVPEFAALKMPPGLSTSRALRSEERRVG